LVVVDLRQFEHEQRPEHAPAPPVDERAEGQHDAATRLASSIGNQAFGQLARQGAGILPDGTAHPDVEHTIARTRGSGQTLDAGTQAKMSGLGGNFGKVSVHTDETAHELAHSVSARAFTTGPDIYFAKGEYNPGSSEGDRLLAHELSHVVQQEGAPTSGPLTVSNPGEALETEADHATRGLFG
jgi:Domain of unknown function (DUF4157)